MMLTQHVQAALLLLLLAALPRTSARVHGLSDRVLKGARPSPTPATFYRPQLPFVKAQTVPTAKTFTQFAISGDISAADATSVTVHGVRITCPDNLVVQFPANTDVWSKASPGTLVGYEAQVVGNVVNEEPIAGLIYVSVDFANVGQGIITAISADGTITVSTQKGPSTVQIKLNDPTGQYGPKTSSPDDRFCVDNANPTVTSSTGFPMCIPFAGNKDTCSSANRPAIDPAKVGTNQPGPWCRNFQAAGVPANWRPVIGDFTPLAISHPVLGISSFICSAFVMPPVPNFVLSGIDLATPGNLAAAGPPPPVAGNGSPDPRLMAPFVVGDTITWSGAVFPGSPFVWAHAIQADVAIYTFPGTLPAYLAIQEFLVSSGNAAGTSVTGFAQEAKDRFSMEAVVTDVLTPVDFYAVDIGNGVNQLSLPTGPASLGEEVHRWMTTSEMTAGVSGPLVGSGVNAVAIGGGVTTAHTFAPMNRQRLQANPAPPGYVDSPTRTYRAMYRSLCLPPARYLCGPPPNAASNVFTLKNVAAPAVDAPNMTQLELGQGMLTTACSQRMRTPSGLLAGTYTAPAFEYIFPEGTTPGNPQVPANMWNFDFLVNGEGGVYSAGGLKPTPW